MPGRGLVSLPTAPSASSSASLKVTSVFDHGGFIVENPKRLNKNSLIGSFDLKMPSGSLKDATLDAGILRGWWRRWPHAEPAWALPAGLVVVDLDRKQNEDGLRDFAAHEGVSPDDVSTPQATTPSGGRHLVFAADGAEYRNGVRINGSAIDLRTLGGYVVLPGPNNGRAWLKPLSTPIAPAPKWIAPTASAKARPQGEPRPFTGETPDARAALDRACKAIKEAPVGEQETTLNRECFSIGGFVGAGVLDAETAIAALTAAANAMPAYAEPWRDLEQKVRRSVGEGMREPREDRNDRAAQSTDALVWYGDEPPKPPQYLIDETLPEQGVAILGGQWGAGKTFAGADLAAATIVGGEFAGKLVKRTGGCLWLAAEGETEIETRVHAAIAARGGEATQRQPFARQSGSVPCLTEKDAFERLKALAAQAAEHLRKNFDVELALITIDTLSAAAGFDDENSAAQTQKVLTIIAALARETKALVILIDHYGKIIETGVRGRLKRQKRSCRCNPRLPRRSGPGDGRDKQPPDGSDEAAAGPHWARHSLRPRANGRPHDLHRELAGGHRTGAKRGEGQAVERQHAQNAPSPSCPLWALRKIIGTISGRRSSSIGAPDTPARKSDASIRKKSTRIRKSRRAFRPKTNRPPGRPGDSRSARFSVHRAPDKDDDRGVNRQSRCGDQ
jgi:AAA domain/Bifunctional DNA primase/polymerase, N-terminal